MWNWDADAKVLRDELVGAFDQEKAKVGGLLRDCEIFAYLRIAFVWSSTEHSAVHCYMQSKQFWHLKTPPAMATI